MCFTGFVAGEALDVLIILPDGSVQPISRSVGDDGTARMQWISFADEPLGVYTVTANQGSSHARRPSPCKRRRPRSSAPTRPRSRPATVVRLVAAGYRPGETVIFHLYLARQGAPARGSALFHHSVADHGAAGGSLFTLQTLESTPQGSYLIVDGSAGNRGATFEVE